MDQEGGRVQRFRDGFTMLPSMQAFQETLSATEQVSFAKETRLANGSRNDCFGY